MRRQSDGKPEQELARTAADPPDHRAVRVVRVGCGDELGPEGWCQGPGAPQGARQEPGVTRGHRSSLGRHRPEGGPGRRPGAASIVYFYYGDSKYTTLGQETLHL